MRKEPFCERRELRAEQLTCDLAIVGGGLAGTCCAITAARAGLHVVLIQDRPVLGGNASSEVRLWTLGATAHMGSTNRWAREGGVLDELLVENVWRNPEGNALIFDTILLERVLNESKVTLLLNTAVFHLTKSSADRIESVRAFCSQNSTLYEVRAPLFCDASGDGVAGFLAGAAFRMGAESADEFGEKFAPAKEYGELLGHSIYFYSKDAGRPVQFVPPSFALEDVPGKIPRYRQFSDKAHGCNLWWIEYGGRLDTVHDTELIKMELWKVVYGVWNYIKNSGKFPDAETLTLEWVGHIPGKRESRRFEGDYMLRQQDVIEQRHHEDAVAFGGWALDLHPSDGVFSEKPGCTHWRMRGPYQIPYRCLYSKNIENLFLAGRIISVTHVAFGSTRVMATVAHAAQAVALAAVICKRDAVSPRAISTGERIVELQRELMCSGQHIPGYRLRDDEDLARRAKITASSELHLAGFPDDAEPIRLECSWAQMLPVRAGRAPAVTFVVDAAEPTELRLELRMSQRTENHTPDVTLATRSVQLGAGEKQKVVFDFDADIEESRYLFYCLMQNEHVSVHTSEQRVSGVLSVGYRYTQAPGEDIGVETFEVWVPKRRPGGRNFAIQIDPPIDLFAAQNLTNCVQRPTCEPNAWIAAFADDAPSLTLEWAAPQQIARIELFFDADYDHPMESVLMGHPERAMPFCISRYRLRDGDGNVLVDRENHHSRATVLFDEPVRTDRLRFESLGTHGRAPSALFEIRCYGREK